MMENFRISGLEVKNVGAFEDLKLDFPEKTNPDKAEIHIFTGENGTGKSTILYALAAAFQNEYRTPSSPFTVSSEINILHRFRFNDKTSIVKTFAKNKLIFSINGGYISNSPDSYESINFYESEIENYGEDVAMSFTKHNSRLENSPKHFVLFAYSGYRNIKNDRIVSIQESLVHPLSASLDFNNKYTNSVSELFDWIANTKTKEALELINKNKEKSEKYKKAIQRIEEAITEIIEQSVEFILEIEPLNVLIKVNGLVLDFDLLPDGLKSIISWISDLLMRMDRIKWVNDVEVLDRNFILFLDEIEVHLHPAWQRKILPVVQKLFKNAQIFISTHSPFVVGSVDDAWIYRFKLDEQGSSHLDGNPIQSEDAKSYPHILQEIFGIKARFGVEIERKLEEFYRLRDELFNGKDENLSKIKKIIEDLSGQGIELDSILGFELRQIEKIIKQPILDK